MATKKEKPEEYNYLEHKEITIEKALKKYCSADTYIVNPSMEFQGGEAIFNMDAKIQSLKVENSVLRELVDWDKLEEDDESN